MWQLGVPTRWGFAIGGRNVACRGVYHQIIEHDSSIHSDEEYLWYMYRYGEDVRIINTHSLVEERMD